MFGYSKECFECLICDIENDIAYVEVIDNKDRDSSMEIPKNDLVSAKILFKKGNVFSFILKQFCGWEKIIFVPIKRNKKLSSLLKNKDKMNKLDKYYENKYGDV